MAAALNLPSLVRPQPHFFDMPPEIHSAPLPQQSRGEFHTKEEEHSDDLGDDGNMSDDGLDQVEGETGAQRKARRNVNTAEKRANHNAIERARRENLNGRFMELAEALPTMNANKRPSKNTIVVKALEFVQSARMREQALEQQNVNLRAEINELRGKLGMPPIPSSAGPLSAALHAKAHGRVVHGGHNAHNVIKHQAVADQASPYPMATQQPQSLFRHQPQPARHLAHHPNGASYGGPYLPQDPIAAAYYGFVGGVDAARRPSLGGSSANETGSDSDVSLVHTPPQLANSFPTVAAAFPYDDHTTVAPRGLPGPILEYPSCSGAGSLPSITAAGVTGWSSIGGVGYPGGNYSIYN